MISIHGWKREYSPSTEMPWYMYIFKNRFSRTLIFLWAMCFTTNVVLGWQPLSAMFFATGTYRWKCDPSYIDEKPCGEQYSAVQSLIIIFSSTQYVFTVIGGLLYDNIGPMYTAAVGEWAHFLGWILLAISSQTVQLYIPAMMLIGASVNVLGLPAIALADMFPSRAALMLAMTVAFQGVGSVIPVVMKVISESQNWSLGGILLGYALIFVLPTAIIYPLACPYNKISATVIEDEPKQTFEAVVLDASHDDGEECVIENQVDSQDNEIASAKNATDWKLLWTELTSSDWLLFTVAYSVQVMQNGFYPTTIAKHSGEAVSNLLGYFYPTISIWGILLILPIDFGYMSSLIALLITIIAMQVPYIFSFISIRRFHYAGVVIYTLCDAILYTFKFTWAQERFQPVNCGLLIGIMGTVSGLLSLVNLGLSDLPYNSVAIGYMCLAVCSSAISFYLYMTTNKKNEKLNVTEKEKMKFDSEACSSAASEIADANQPTYATGIELC